MVMMLAVAVVLVVAATAQEEQEEQGFISHVARNIEAARDPFLRAQQMAELEHVFAFGDKFDFNQKQIDLTEFYGDQGLEGGKEERPESRKTVEGEGLQEHTERAGLKGWFDSFDFGDRDFYTARNRAQAPEVQEEEEEEERKEGYDKEVTTEARRRVFAKYKTSTVKPSMAPATVGRVRKVVAVRSKEVDEGRRELAEGNERRRPALKSTWNTYPSVPTSTTPQELWYQGGRGLTKEVGRPSTGSVRRASNNKRGGERKEVRPRERVKERARVKGRPRVSTEAPVRGWLDPLHETGGDWQTQV